MVRKKCEDTGECETPVAVQLHIRECDRRWEEMEKEYIPLLKEYHVNKKVAGILLLVLLGGWGAISAAVKSSLEWKMEQTKQEVIEAVKRAK